MTLHPDDTREYWLKRYERPLGDWTQGELERELETLHMLMDDEAREPVADSPEARADRQALLNRWEQECAALIAELEARR